MKKILTVVAAMTIMGSIASVASAADRLTVKNSASSIVFKVDETGLMTSGALNSDPVSKKVGIGTNAYVTPMSTLHNAEFDGANALRGITASQHNTGAQGAVINFVKSGWDTTNNVPIQPVANNYIGVFSGQFWNGTAYDRAGQFGFRNDAAVSAGSFPTAILFQTGDKAVNMKEGLRISSSQNVVAGNAGAYAAGPLATSATGGFLYVPTVAGGLTSCGSAVGSSTVGQLYPGHAPVWFDSTNNQICACNGTVVKCTAAMN